MADRQLGNHAGLPIKSSTQNGGGATATESFKDADLLDVNAMRARLTAIDGATYTATRLNQMSYNDMVYAIRLLDHPTTV